MTTKNDTVQLSVRFEPAVHRKIQAMAKKENRTLNSYVNYVVIKALKGENEPV